MHLLCGPVDVASLPVPASSPRAAGADSTLEARVRVLEDRLARLERQLGLADAGDGDGDR